MRCALSFNEDERLYDQEVSAWGEMQSMNEEPSYKESDIADPGDKRLFEGMKWMIDEVYSDLECMEDDGMITEEASEHLQALMSGNLAMMLFSILDRQE